MKKYILTALMILNSHQFFAASQQLSVIDRQNLVQRWKNAETMTSVYNLVQNLENDQKEQLFLDLIDAYQNKFIQAFKENNFLYFMSNDFYKNIIPYSSFFENLWSSSSVIAKLLQFFNFFYTVENIIDMNIVNQNLELYYTLLDGYARERGKTLKIIADRTIVAKVVNESRP